MSTKKRRPKGEGTLFQRDGKWIGRLTYEDPLTGRPKRTQVSAKTMRATSEKLRAVRARVEAGGPPRDDKAHFGTFASEWVRSSLEASDRKRSTKTLYAGLTKTHIVDSDLGRTPMNRVTPSTVERFITQLRGKGLADSSVRQVYTVARAIGDAAVRDSLISRNPFAVVRRPRVGKIEASHLSPAQVAALLDAAGETRYAPLFAFMVNTAMRRGEALALKWTDVDLTANVAHVRGTLARIDGALVSTDPKSKSSRRVVYLTQSAVDALEKVKRRTAEDRRRAGSKWVDTGYVFSTEFGEPSDPRNALRALKAAAARADLPGIGLHTLRHTAGSLMLIHGVPMSTVSKVMGHAGIAITVDTYGHIAPDVQRGAADALQAALASSAAS